MIIIPWARHRTSNKIINTQARTKQHEHDILLSIMIAIVFDNVLTCCTLSNVDWSTFPKCFLPTM